MNFTWIVLCFQDICYHLQKRVKNDTEFYSEKGRTGESLTMGRVRIPDDVLTSSDRATVSVP